MSNEKGKYVILSVAVVAIVAVAIIVVVFSGGPPVDYYSCVADSDCAIVSSGCCGCSAGGEATAVNQASKNSWIEGLSSGCLGTACPAVMSRNISCFSQPKCVNSACQLVPDKAAVCDSSVVKNCELSPEESWNLVGSMGISCTKVFEMCGFPRQTELSTGKSQYVQGEQVTVSLVYGPQIYFWSGRPWSVQRLEGSDWVDVPIPDQEGLLCGNISNCDEVNIGAFEDCPPTLLCEEGMFEVSKWYKVEGKQELGWNQVVVRDGMQFSCMGPGGESEVRTCVDLVQVQPGQYRARYEYVTEIDGDDPTRRDLDIKYAETEFAIEYIARNCNENVLCPMAEEEIEQCTCKEGQEKFYSMCGAYCATNSGIQCSSHNDCPQGEQCLSFDGGEWLCTGQWAGCYHNDPENPDMEICAD